VVELKYLIVVLNIADRLKPPAKSDKVLGPRKELWCEFHEAFGHHINNCLALGYQLDELVKNGFLKDYLAGSTETTALTVPEENQTHEILIHGEVHTISGGFSRGGPTASQRKKYVRSVSLGVEEFSDDPWELILPVDQNVGACLVKLGSTCAPRQPPSFATIHLKNLQKNRAAPLRPIALQRPSQ